MRGRLLLGLAALAVAGVVAPAAAVPHHGWVVAAGRPSTPRAAGRLEPRGRWLIDRFGRVVIVHGLQVAHKRAPYHPSRAGFRALDGRRIHRWGFDAVRLAWFWAGLEPRRGDVDRAYLREIVREGRVLARHHLYTLLEAHQDLYGPAIDGDGFPSWATVTDQLPALPHSAADNVAPRTDAAFANLYADTDGIADAFAHAWAVMARAFRHNPRLLGYDLINEPGPGAQVALCVVPVGCPGFDRFTLEPFEERVASVVHADDPGAIAFLEPDIAFDFGVSSWLTTPSATAEPAGFAFHDYCLPPTVIGQPDHESRSPLYAACKVLDEHVFDNAHQTAAAMGAPELLDEFGDTQDLADIRRMVELADSRLEGWMYWSHKDWVDVPGGAGSGALYDNSNDDRSLRRAKLKVLAEPYPQAIAGTPLGYRYNPARGILTFRFRTRPSVRAPTVVSVPRIEYPNGYRVNVSAARVTSSRDAPHLTLAAAGRSPHVVRVRVAPARPQ